MTFSKKKIKAEYGQFIKEYARKKSKNGFDPNDRQYDRKLEAIIKRMKPEELSALIDEQNDPCE